MERLHQLYHDFTTIRSMGERYFPEEARDEAVKAARHVNGVSAVLAPLVAGEGRWPEANAYAAAVAGVDVATDHHGLDLLPDRMPEAANGDAVYPCLEPLSLAQQQARSPRFYDAMAGLAAAQDDSRRQRECADREYLADVTERKGGYAFTAHVCALAEGVDDRVWEWAMDTGFTMQLLDDHLDRQEDEDEGINTLFTEGVFTSPRLARRIEQTAELTEAVWGNTRAARRLVRLMWAHYYAALVEHRRPGTLSTLLPWYF